MQTRIKRIVVLALPMVLLAGLTSPAFAIDVNTELDTIADDGLCSLREAITNANSGHALFPTLGECAAGSGPDTSDTINFTADFTITLGSALPGVFAGLTIMGTGMANTIIQSSSCNPVTLPGGCTPATYRVLEFQNGTSILQDVTIRHGNCDGACSAIGTFGGGVFNTATLTVKNSSVQSNRASVGGGGIYSNGPQLTIDGSKVIQNKSVGFRGGGINSASPVLHIVNGSLIAENSAELDVGGGLFYIGTSGLISHSTFSNNLAGDAGGVYSASPLTIAYSTFSANAAHGLAGGLLLKNNTTILSSAITDNVADGDGGGVVILPGGAVAITLANTTISGNISDGPNGAANQAVGGLAAQSGSVVNLYNVTLTDNHGAYVGGISDLDSPGSIFNIYNSIISNNPGSTYDDCYVLSGTMDFGGKPGILKNSAGCSPLNAGLVSNEDPLLEFLTDNGGPTLTHSLAEDSPAIDGGDDVVCADANTVNNLDQRGKSRLVGAHCDLGAFEFQILIFEGSFETP